MHPDNILVEENIVRITAYQLWKGRGCPVGTAERDWFEARQLVAETLAKESSARARTGEQMPQQATAQATAIRGEADGARSSGHPCSDRELPAALESKYTAPIVGIASITPAQLRAAAEPVNHAGAHAISSKKGRGSRAASGSSKRRRH